MSLIGLFWAPLTPAMIIGCLSPYLFPLGVLLLMRCDDKKNKIRGIVLTMLGLFCFSALAW